MDKKYKHLSFDDRLEIGKGLKNNDSFKKIAENINKNCSTISKEIRNHFKAINSGAIGRPSFDCINGKNCEFRSKGTLCNSSTCQHYQKKTMAIA